MAFSSARTRLETVLSADKYIKDALDRWTLMVDMIDVGDEKGSSSESAWAALFKEDAVFTETIACLFLPPDIDEDPSKLVTGRTPLAFAPAEVLAKMANRQHDTLVEPDDLMRILLDREVRRVCTVHRDLAAQWASLLEATNWWRACVTLDPKPEPPSNARIQALARLSKLQVSFFAYLETFSPFVDDTDDTDDYEVRAEIVRRDFKLDAITYHRSFETARERRDKIYRIVESRDTVLK
jgi:hypothetical protein